MILLGLTGSIGMGKSTTAAIFARQGDAVIDSDAIVHDLYRGEAVAPVEAAFPGVAADGAIDRTRLGAAVFGNPEAMARLEAIIHPMVRARSDAALAEAAMRAQALAEDSTDNQAYRFDLIKTGSGPIQISTQALWTQISSDLKDALSPATISRRFHNGLAESIAATALTLFEDHSTWQDRQVALTGGVFQNSLLQQLTEAALRRAGFEVLVHQQVPANDGGLALGQACISAARCLKTREANSACA